MKQRYNVIVTDTSHRTIIRTRHERKSHVYWSDITKNSRYFDSNGNEISKEQVEETVAGKAATVYFNITPKQSELYIDGELIKLGSGWVNSTTGPHEILITKEGYSDSTFFTVFYKKSYVTVELYELGCF